AVPLFERKANKLEPTPAGRAYQACLWHLFNTFSALTEQVKAMASPNWLTVGVGRSLSISWPLPRLAAREMTAPKVYRQFATGSVGVAVGIRPYMDDDVKAGRLVAPFVQSVPKGMQWYLVYRDARRGELGFAAFREWITKAAKASAKQAVA